VKPSPDLPAPPKGLWEVVSEARFLGRYQAQVGGFSLPVWAGTWKTMIFVFRQQKSWWDRQWPNRPPPYPQDKTPRLLDLESQVNFPVTVHHYYLRIYTIWPKVSGHSS